MYNNDSSYDLKNRVNFKDLLFFVYPDHSGVFSGINFIKNIYGPKWENKFQTKMFLNTLSYENQRISKSIVESFEQPEK